MKLRKPHDPRNASIPEALAYLASVCDGATTRDGIGFGYEEQDGHQLLAYGAQNWSAQHRKRAAWIVRYYRRQLSAAGFDVDQILKGRTNRMARRRARKLAVADWYPDPTGFSMFRWHNGRRWTDQTNPPHQHGAQRRAPDQQQLV